MDVCLKEIKAVHEDITDRDKDFQLAKQLLADAESVFLMGFGFGTKNVERLGLAGISPSAHYLGTAYESTPLEIRRTRKLLADRVALFNCQCIQFLRENALLE
jgi:hypothetical protein